MTNFMWATGVPQTGWTVGYETLQFSKLSVQYWSVPVSATKAGAPYNPGADVLQFAFMPTPTQTPVTADWVSGVWETVPTSIIYPYNAKCLVGTAGTTALTSGSYNVYMKVTDNPEAPVFIVGTLGII